MDAAPSQEVLTGRLDAARLDELWSDLERDARDLRVVVRDSPGRPARAVAPTVASARTALRDGFAVVLRYAAAGRQWSDTLIPDGDGVRLVRCAPSP